MLFIWKSTHMLFSSLHCCPALLLIIPRSEMKCYFFMEIFPESQIRENFCVIKIPPSHFYMQFFPQYLLIHFFFMIIISLTRMRVETVQFCSFWISSAWTHNNCYWNSWVKKLWSLALVIQPNCGRSKGANEKE